MLYVHTIGRIGKDCQVITGAHGSFIAFDIAVDDYSHGTNTTTWVRVRSKKENHIRLSEYLTKGRLILIEGTLSASLWKDKNENYQIQLSITADSLEFVNTGKREGAASDATEQTDTASDVPAPPVDMPQDDKDDLPF
ncbi:single-stranded DNA-binding protein [Bacteroides hominis]|uniref:single-stranded DNA-binding protein n=1 Tax=Bacteroides hominis TaxID=2763023 RepID=UPI00164C7909|nr:single-stranded DNA-binding protein [Bacteroides hominis (ex Liu et al. 2022)]MBC5614582.1 single-stranded DNA-binding protein [Bacteroides hominis (ex Liu et al. 2022)]